MISVKIFFLLFLNIIFSKSLEAKDKSIQNCCRRIPHEYNIGYDISGRAVRLDMGRCSTSCDDIKVPYRYVSVLQRIKEEQKRTNEGVSSGGIHFRSRASCEVSALHVETVTFNRGPKVFDVIDDCACRKVPKTCERVSKLKRFFIGTKYEATVDIGMCLGSCRRKKNGKVCRAIKTSSHPIMGPNGMISIQSIAECRCESTCYRQQFNVAVTEQKMQPDGVAKLSTKIIDVGRCVGTCGSIGRCVVRSKKDGKCLMSLETDDVKCSPVRVHDVTYINHRGEEDHVAKIKRCGCT